MITNQLPNTIIFPFPVFVRFRKASKVYFAIVTAAKKNNKDPSVLDYVFCRIYNQRGERVKSDDYLYDVDIKDWQQISWDHLQKSDIWPGFESTHDKKILMAQIKPMYMLLRWYRPKPIAQRS